MAVPFRYEYHPTPIHQLNPATKLVLFSVFLILGEFFIDPRVMGPVILGLVIVLMIAKVPLKAYRGIIVLACFMTILPNFWMAITQLDPNLFKNYSHEFVSKVILELTPPSFPVFGRTAITYGSLLWLSTNPFRIVTVILAMAGLLHTTSLAEVISVLSRAKAPFPVIYITTVALKFVPDIVARINIIQKAQRVRGWSDEGRNPIKKIQQVRPLFVPLIRSVIRSVDAVNISVKNRAFGLGPVTGLADFEFQKRDKVVIVACALAMILVIFLYLKWGIGEM